MNAVDAKGRLSVPSSIRQIIERRSEAKVLVLAPHDTLDCLIGYDLNWSASRLAREQELRSDRPDKMADMAMRAAAFASIMQVTYDGSGRIVLPPRLKRRAGIEGQALFMGMGFEFYVWNPQKALACEIAEIREAAQMEIEDQEAA